jgi:hypothetical protein
MRVEIKRLITQFLPQDVRRDNDMRRDEKGREGSRRLGETGNSGHVKPISFSGIIQDLSYDLDPTVQRKPLLTL